MASRPTITGTAADQRSVDEAPLAPFSQVTIADPNRGRDTVTIVLAGAGGSLAGDGLESADDGTYSLSGTAAQVTSALRALTFTPAAGQPGSRSTTRFRLTDRSSAAPNAPAVDSTTTVIDDDTPSPPAAPRLTTAADTGVSQDDGVTDDAVPTVAGNARPGAAVTVYAGDRVVGQGVAAGSGAYTIPLSGLSEGANAVRATQTVHGLTSDLGASRKITVDTAPPTIAAVKPRGPGIGGTGAGDLGPSKTVVFSVSTTEPVFVDGGTPTLSLNDGGVATYTGGSGKGLLTFSYTVAPGENTGALAVTGLSTGGAAVTDRAGNALDLASLASAAVPAGPLVVDTAAPVVIPSSPGGATGNPRVTLTGTVAGADGKTRISAFDGSAKAVATAKVRPDGSFSLPIRLTAGINAISLVSTDGAGNASRPAEVTYTSVPDTVTLDPGVAYRAGAFTITGTASSVSGIARVEIDARVGGKLEDLGAADVGADGAFTFTDVVGADQQGFFRAKLTGAAGETATSADPGFSLAGGLGPTGAVGRQTAYTADGAAVAAVSLFRPDGQRFVGVEAPGQTVDLQPFDIVAAHRRAGTAFVFGPGDGLAVIHGFELGGAGHDTVLLPSSDFRDFADVLRHTGDVGGSAIVTDPKTGDALRLAGVTTAELKAHPKDVAFTG